MVSNYQLLEETEESFQNTLNHDKLHIIQKEVELGFVRMTIKFDEDISLGKIEKIHDYLERKGWKDVNAGSSINKRVYEWRWEDNMGAIDPKKALVKLRENSLVNVEVLEDDLAYSKVKLSLDNHIRMSELENIGENLDEKGWKKVDEESELGNHVVYEWNKKSLIQ